MAPDFADQLARLRVATDTGHLPSDLGRWAIARLLEPPPSQTPTERKAERDRLWREVAGLLRSGRDPARFIHDELWRLSDSSSTPLDPGTISCMLWQALRWDGGRVPDLKTISRALRDKI